MKYLVVLPALCIVTISAMAQPLLINVPRPAYDYELIDAVPEGVIATADRSSISEFLATKQSARTAFETRALDACPEFVDSRITVMEFARRLDRDLAITNQEISEAYGRMYASLSPLGKWAIQSTLGQATEMSADTQLVAIAEVAPSVAEYKFLEVCGEVGTTTADKDE